MQFVRRLLLAWLVGLISLSAAARVQASFLYEPNNSPSNATVIPANTFVVSATLNPLQPDTILAEFDPAYSMAPIFSPAGNGTVTEWDGVPLKDPYGPAGDPGTGSAYFRISGAGDVNFTGNHTQTGIFTYQLKVYSSAHVLLQTISGTNAISPAASNHPGTVKSIWVDPAPAQIGGTVDVTLTNLVGPGDVDFYSFSGLLSGQSFTASINSAGFQPRLGLWANPGTRVLSTDLPTFTGSADNSGQVLIGVTAHGDTNFTGAQQTATGSYTLTITPIPAPEPAGVVLLGLGGTLAFLFRQYRRRRRPPLDCAPLG